MSDMYSMAYSNGYTGDTGLAFPCVSGKLHETSSFELQRKRESDPHRLNIQNVCYNGDKKEVPDMSFVGMVFRNDRIIAFGDSKATIELNGLLQQDTSRGYVPKVFLFHEYALCVYGTNEISMVKSGKKTVIYIEEWISQNTGSDPFTLAYDLFSLICDPGVTGNPNIRILAGYKGEKYQIPDINGNTAIFLSVSKTAVNIEIRHPLVDEAVFGGASQYCEFFNLHSSLLVWDDIEMLRGVLEKVIKDFTRTLQYNPVGLPVNILEWFPV